MKKTIIAMAIIATTLTACSEPVKAEVFGSVEKKWDNGTEAISSEDTYLGYSIYEDLGNGLYAQGEISMDLSSTATERKTFIGLANSIAAISVGKQGSVQGDLGNNTIDIFEGPGFDVNNSADIDNSIIGSVNISGLKILGSNIPTSAENDSYEVGAKLNIGPVALGGVYAETAANVTNKLVGATITYNGVDIGGVFEIEKDAAGTETNTVTTVSTISSGTNDIKAGFQDVENISETYTLEGVHNFSSKTSAYVNYQKSETDVGVKNDTTTVGMRVQF
jgi:hypothetical protein